MEELHEAAMAYYTNASTEQKNLAKQFFRSMDDDCSGRVSLQQFTDFLSENGCLASVDPKVFQQLDKNGDGYLDFFEVLTLYYASQRETVSCDKCSKLLCGLHFTCVECFETPSSKTFDLCINCYKEMKYTHQHGVFLDSYALLRSRRNHQPPEESESPQPNNDDKFSLSKAVEAFDVGSAVGSIVVSTVGSVGGVAVAVGLTTCTIM